MMAGLALLVSIWSHGGAIARDFFGAFEFPDAFVSGPALTPEARAKLDAMDGVTGTCAISLHLIETDTFGVSGFTRYTSTFIAFEPEPFFELAELKWIEGSLEVALPKLVAGGAVIVAREFRVARGLGVGDTFVCYEDGQRHEFEIVGVVTSPGLDIVSKFFNIGEEYTQQALHAVFGSRDDLRDRFGSESINLIQIQLAEGVDDEAAVEAIRLELFPYGILDAGSGRAIKRQILEVFGGALTAFSAVAVCAMIVACFGVANLIMAGIDTRRFEFGVLRAVGAGPGVLLRLVLGEAVIIALAACVLGTAMGFQIAWAGRRMNRLLVGIDLDLLVPVTGMAIGWGAVMVITLLAALPAALAVMRSPPRELLAAR
jgi:putative ABC transport system permease protein